MGSKDALGAGGENPIDARPPIVELEVWWGRHGDGYRHGRQPDSAQIPHVRGPRGRLVIGDVMHRVPRRINHLESPAADLDRLAALEDLDLTRWDWEKAAPVSIHVRPKDAGRARQ